MVEKARRVRLLSPLDESLCGPFPTVRCADFMIQVLEDYDKKLQHLRFELTRMQEEYEAFEAECQRQRSALVRRR